MYHAAVADGSKPSGIAARASFIVAVGALETTLQLGTVAKMTRVAIQTIERIRVD